MSATRGASATFDYGRATDDDTLAALARVEGLAFGVDTSMALGWLVDDRAKVRVLRRGSTVVGGLLAIPMGQFFGGRSVPMIGIAGVAVAPEERRRGAATALLHAIVREMRRHGAALSALYPAVYSLYRRAGYEIAGMQYRIRVPIATIGVVEPGVTVTPLDVSSPDTRDLRRAARLYRAAAASCPGWLDRDAYIWRRVLRGRSEGDSAGYAVHGDSGVEGYILYRPQKVGSDGRYDLAISDLVATTPAATRRLLCFIRDHGSMARHAVWHGGPDDPFLHGLSGRGGELTAPEPWMLRILHVERALAGRGYSRAVTARLDLHITDDVLRGNRGRFTLHVADGRGEVRRGGRGTLALDIRALAALYSGHMSPHRLAATGAITGSPRALDSAAAVFAGPPPSCRDFF